MAHPIIVALSFATVLCATDQDCANRNFVNGTCYQSRGLSLKGTCGCPLGKSLDIDHLRCIDDDTFVTQEQFGVLLVENIKVRVHRIHFPGSWACSAAHSTCHYHHGHLSAMVLAPNLFNLPEVALEDILWRCDNTDDIAPPIFAPGKAPYGWDKAYVAVLNELSLCLLPLANISLTVPLVVNPRQCVSDADCPDYQACFTRTDTGARFCQCMEYMVYSPKAGHCVMDTGVLHNSYGVAGGIWLDDGPKVWRGSDQALYLLNHSHSIIAKANELDSPITSSYRALFSGHYLWRDRSRKELAHLSSLRLAAAAEIQVSAVTVHTLFTLPSNTSVASQPPGCGANGTLWNREHCACPMGYFGAGCDLNAATCAAARCNGITKGSCSSQLTGCQCGDFRSGIECEVIHCQNNATVGNGDVCFCGPQFIGTFCETRRCFMGTFDVETEECVCNSSLVLAHDNQGNCTRQLCGPGGIPTYDYLGCRCPKDHYYDRSKGVPYCIEKAGKVSTVAIGFSAAAGTILVLLGLFMVC